MHLTRELARAERLKSEVSLMVMDLDNFKEINDNHGHHVGDRALCEVARVLRAAIRPYDICVRYAGDEFIVVLSGCGADEAEHKRAGAAEEHRRRRTSRRGPGKRLQLGISVRRGRVPAGRASRTRRCSLRPTAGCIRTSPAASAHVPRGRSRRRALAPWQRALPELTDLDIQRAAAGILAAARLPASGFRLTGLTVN